jgi:hypothetical protein
MSYRPGEGGSDILATQSSLLQRNLNRLSEDTTGWGVGMMSNCLWQLRPGPEPKRQFRPLRPDLRSESQLHGKLGGAMIDAAPHGGLVPGVFEDDS